MADVYRANDTELPRNVAIKILKTSNQHDTDIRAAFLDEIQLASRCAHENIVMTYDKGELDGSPYIVMEFLHGQSLDKLIRSEEKLTLKQVLQIAQQIASAMQYVHSQNIVHRDLKPQNINVDANGRVKLVDFGIAKSTDWNKTQAGLVKGTAYYMSPEQIMGEPVNFRTDIWSFGILLYEMLSNGQRPFLGNNLDVLWASIVNGTPDYAVLQAKDVPQSVQTIVRRCLEKKPENRYASFSEVGSDLSATLRALSMTDLAAVPSNKAESSEMKKLSTFLVAGALAVAFICIAVLIYDLSTKRNSTAQPLPKEITTATGDMVLVDAGPALIGSDKHKIALKAFYIDKTEVSNGAYAAFLKQKHWRKPKDFADNSPDLPVVNVTLADAIAFATWAGKRLPTSDEWEKAARGPNGRLFPWGDQLNPQLANLAANPNLQKHQLMPVNSFPEGRSLYGALNMVGNVWEWVDTDVKPEPAYLKRLQSEFKLTHDESFYMIRGGDYSFGLSSQILRLLTDAAPFPTEQSSPTIGFRCAKDPKAR